MQVMTIYEKEIIREIHGLHPAFQEKVAHLVHVIKKEFVTSAVDELSSTEEFLSTCGKWQDTRTVEQQLDELYNSRYSTQRTEHAF